MNKQSKDGNISWTDYTWNPIKGLCPVGCWYCYARAMYKRFKMNPEIRPDKIYYPDMIAMPYCPEKPVRIFVCSTFEIFHPSVKKEWRDWIFNVIKYNSTCIFQILTKMPENIDRPMPDNVWLGVSVESRRGCSGRISFLGGAKAKVKFISIEPLLEYRVPILGRIEIPNWIDWVIIGRLTGRGKKHNPPSRWIFSIVRDCKQVGAAIFL
ncbi:unnamed protein product, partial [marine sediment metagenome]